MNSAGKSKTRLKYLQSPFWVVLVLVHLEELLGASASTEEVVSWPSMSTLYKV